MRDWIGDATTLATEVLGPDAATVDQSSEIPRRHFDELAARGFYGLVTDPGMTPRTLADVAEIVVGACLPTAFVWAQHFGALLPVSATDNKELRERYLDDLLTGAVKAGVSHAGSAGQPTLFAREYDDHYVLSGFAPLVTGWGIVDIIAVSARVEADDTIATFILPADLAEKASATPLPMAAADASKTVRLDFDGIRIAKGFLAKRGPAHAVRATRQYNDWLYGTLALGITRRCLQELPEPHRGPIADAYAVARDNLDKGLTGEYDIYQARADASQLAITAAAAVVVAQGSSALLRGSTAERLVREATFALVCASGPPIKAALIGNLTRPKTDNIGT